MDFQKGHSQKRQRENIQKSKEGSNIGVMDNATKGDMCQKGQVCRRARKDLNGT